MFIAASNFALLYSVMNDKDLRAIIKKLSQSLNFARAQLRYFFGFSEDLNINLSSQILNAEVHWNSFICCILLVDNNNKNLVSKIF